MIDNLFVVHDGLLAAGRLPSLARRQQRISARELIFLICCGVLSALAVGFVKMGLRIPGSAIVLSVLPMAFGLSIAPRRLAGTVMGAGALGTALLMALLGLTTYGAGARVSLCLVGPMMDFAVRRGAPGWRLYVALALSGAGANLLALASRAASKLLGLDVAGTRPFGSWWLEALGTYTASGLIAGILGAICWFHFNARRRRSMPA